jgi:transcriptional regulator with XRE-family HTH domain
MPSGTKLAAGEVTQRAMAHLALERAGAGVRQIDLANETGVSRPMVSKYLSGNAVPNLEEFIRLCGALDLDPVEVLRTAGASGVSHRPPLT